MLDVRRMRVLREVAARGSFSAAADALAYTQSAVSQQIAALEREAGTTLVERNARGVRLTDAGRALVEHADAILARLVRRRGRARGHRRPARRAPAPGRLPERRRIDHARGDRALPRAPPGGRAHARARRARARAEPPARRRGRRRARHHRLLPGAARGRHRAPAPARRPDVRRAAQEPPAGAQARAEARGAGRRELDPRHHGLVPRRLDLPALVPGRGLRAADRLQLRRLLRHAGLRGRRRRRLLHPRPRADVRPRGHRGALAGPAPAGAPDHGGDAEGLASSRRPSRRCSTSSSRSATSSPASIAASRWPPSAPLGTPIPVTGRARPGMLAPAWPRTPTSSAAPSRPSRAATCRPCSPSPIPRSSSCPPRRASPVAASPTAATTACAPTSPTSRASGRSCAPSRPSSSRSHDVVVCTGRVYAWGVGRVIDAPAGWVWRLRDGKLVEGRVYENQREALAAAGLERGHGGDIDGSS